MHGRIAGLARAPDINDTDNRPSSLGGREGEREREKERERGGDAKNINERGDANGKSATARRDVVVQPPRRRSRANAMRHSLLTYLSQGGADDNYDEDEDEDDDDNEGDPLSFSRES